MPTLVQNRFDGGIGDQKRNNQTEGVLRRTFSVAKNFDIHSEIGQLVPVPGFTSDISATIEDAEIHKFEEIDGVIYGYGVVVGSGRVKIYERVSGIWSQSTSGQDSSGTRDTSCFIAYKKHLFGGTAASRIWGYDTDGNSFTSTALNLTSFTNIAQGVVHPSDDILYIPYDNKIAKKDDPDASQAANANWTAEALVLPSNLQITSITPHGEFLAIATKPTDGVGNSRVFLWNRVDADVTENIDWGREDLELIGTVENTLVGISLVSDSTTNIGAIIVKFLGAGNTPQIVKRLNAVDSSVRLGDMVQNYLGRLYFFGAIRVAAGGITVDDYYAGIYSIGRRTITEPLAINVEIHVDDLVVNPLSAIHGFFWFGDLLFTSYDNGDSIDIFTGAGAKGNGVFETDIFTLGDPAQDKGAKGVSLAYLPLASGETVKLLYRLNEDVEGGTWTEIFERTGAANPNEQGHEDVTTLEGRLKEIQFRIETTGGAVPLQWKFQYERLANLLS